ncbi:MAG: Lrp/AsnC family transcriptional regulator, partial [Bacteroidota bacterium]
KIPFSQLAEKLRISNSLVHQRVGKLKEHGVLGDAVFKLDPLKLGYRTSAYVLIVLSQGKKGLEELMKSIQAIPEIVELANIAGRYDLMAKIYARDNSHLRDILYDKIDKLDGVEGTNTIISFEVVFSRGLSPMAAIKEQKI